MRFEFPHLLWLLLVLPPALMAFFAWAQRRKARLLTLFVEARLLPTLVEGVSPARQKLSRILLISAVAFLVIAVARPQWGFTWEEARQRGLDIVVAIDTSRSMLAEDVAPNRLARAKLAVLDLMKLARRDRLGLVAFAGTAFLMCPLTLDDEAFRQSVSSLDTDIIPQGGTALAPAIEAALDAFKNDADNHKVLVLFTDGEDHDEEAVAAAEKAAKDGLRIFTVGLGSAEGELLRITDRRGRQEFIKDQDGNVVKSRLNEPLLQQLATKGNGFYLPLRGAQTIETLYERGLEPLPKSEGDAMRFKRYHERYQWPLGLAFLALIAEVLLPARARKRPARPVMKPAAAVAAMALLLFTVASDAKASSVSAQKQYQAGQYDRALKEYRQLLDRRPDDARLNYNAGAAAYRDGQFAEAMQQFGQATTAQDLKIQQHGYYNQGNALFRLGENLPPAAAEAAETQAQSGRPADRMAAWEQSLKSFESALKLDPKDADAEHNRDYVKLKLEELKKEQEQQKQDKQDQSKDDQKQDQDEQKKDQKDQQAKDDQKQSDQQKKQDQKKDEQKQDSQKDSKDKKDDQKSKQPDQKQKPDDQSKKQPSPSDQQKQSKDQNQQQQDGEGEAKPGQMSPQQARQLMDSQRGEEQMLRPVAPATEKPPAKNW